MDSPVELVSVKLQPPDQASELDQNFMKHFQFLKDVREKINDKETHPNPARTKMFGIRCNFGTDDFFFLSLFALAIRAAWFCYGLGVSIYMFILPGSCATFEVPLTVKVSLLGTLVLYGVVIICFIITAILSSLGSLIRHKPREKVVVCAYILVLLFVVELVWLVFSIYAAVDAYSSTDNSTVVDMIGGVASGMDGGVASGSGQGVANGSGQGVVSSGGVASGSGQDVISNADRECSVMRLFLVAVILAWFISLLIMMLFMCNLDPCGCFVVSRHIKNMVKRNKCKQDDETIRQRSLKDYKELKRVSGHHSNSVGSALCWAKFRQIFCPCVRRDGLSPFKKAAVSDVVNILRILFSDVDLTFSDLLAGFLLAGLYQRNLKAADKSRNRELTRATVKLLKEQGYMAPHYVTPSLKPLTHEETEQLGKELNYYFKFCVASYGAPIQVYLNPCTGPITLCIAARGCCCCNCCQLEQFDGDTCFPNSAAIRDIAGVRPENLIHGSFINCVCRVPFYVAEDWDPQTGKTRVIVAIRGTLSLQDALTDVSVTMLKIPNGLLGAQPSYIHTGFYESADFIYQNLIENATFKRMLSDQNVEEIVLTGHSLGAAVASVLAVLFKDRHKEDPWISKLKAVTFSTPGAIMNYPLAEKTVDFIYTVVTGNDLVSRWLGVSFEKSSERIQKQKKEDSTKIPRQCLEVEDKRWCTVLCLEDHKTYTSPVKKLESEDGLGVGDTDIQPGKHVVWFYGGAPNFKSLWMTLRSLGYLKHLVEAMLVTVDCPKHQVLCCSTSSLSCRPQVVEDEDILGLAYSQKDLQSVGPGSLDLGGDPESVSEKLKKYKPNVSVKRTLNNKEAKETVQALCKGLCLVKGGASESNDHPAMFLPGQILHMEDSSQYAVKMCGGLKKKRMVRCCWKAREDISTIIVDPDMLLDHTPHRVKSMLERFQQYPDVNGYSAAELEVGGDNQEAAAKRHFSA